MKKKKFKKLLKQIVKAYEADQKIYAKLKGASKSNIFPRGSYVGSDGQHKIN